MALFKKDRREPVPPAQTDVHDTSVGTAVTAGSGVGAGAVSAGMLRRPSTAMQA